MARKVGKHGRKMKVFRRPKLGPKGKSEHSSKPGFWWQLDIFDERGIIRHKIKCNGPKKVKAIPGDPFNLLS